MYFLQNCKNENKSDIREFFFIQNTFIRRKVSERTQMEAKNFQRKRKTWSNLVASRTHGFLFFKEGASTCLANKGTRY